MALPFRLPKLSLRRQITLLAIFIIVLFGLTVVWITAALRNSESVIINEDKKRLADAALTLAREYTTRARFSIQHHEAAPLENAKGRSSQSILTLITGAVLQNEQGVEGGFYAAASGALPGYAYPTYEGTEVKRDIPPAERPSILEVVRDATQRQRPAEKVLRGARDVILYEAVPIREGGQVRGSAWVMERLYDLNAQNRLRIYFAAIGFGGASLLCLVFALWVTRNLQHGVATIEAGLRGLEDNLGAHIRTDDEEEIRCIAAAVNRLASTLKHKIENERNMESRLRHSEQLAALGRLVAGVAHEVRNPLATIRLRVQMCQNQTPEQSIQRSCAVMLEEIDRLNAIVERLLCFAQPMTVSRTPTDLRALLERRLEAFRERARESRVQVITNFPEAGIFLPVDAAKISQVFDNLIQNAMDALTARGGLLRITLGRDDRAPDSGRPVAIQFQDTGEGMTADEQEKMFDPFFTTKANGTGLGLSICYELVKAHDGEIKVRSGKGEGTTVRILLPESVREAVVATVSAFC